MFASLKSKNLAQTLAEPAPGRAANRRAFPLRAESLAEPARRSERFRVLFSSERTSGLPLAARSAGNPKLRLWVAAADVAAGRRRLAHRRFEKEREAASPAQAAIAAAAVSAVGSFIVACLILWTPLPLQIAAGSFERAGFKIEGISGCWATGYRIERVEKSGSGAGVELRDVRFAPATVWTGDEVAVELRDFSVGSARVAWDEEALAQSIAILLRSAEPDDRSEAEARKPSSLARSAQAIGALGSKALAAFALLTVRAPRFDVQDVALEPRSPNGGLEPQKIQSKRLYASGIEWKGPRGSLSFERFFFESEALEVDASELLIRGQRTEFAKEAVVRARPALAPDVIRAPIEARFSGTVVHEEDRVSWREIRGKAYVAGNELDCRNAVLAIDRERTKDTPWGDALAAACP